MARVQPTMSWTQLRNICEVFEWKDPKTGVKVRGHNPPGGKDGKGVSRVPFYIKYVTGKGVCESGFCTCIKVFPSIKQRMIQFTESKQIRRVRDYLIMEIDGIRIVTH